MGRCTIKSVITNSQGETSYQIEHDRDNSLPLAEYKRVTEKIAKNIADGNDSGIMHHALLLRLNQLTVVVHGAVIQSRVFPVNTDDVYEVGGSYITVEINGNSNDSMLAPPNSAPAYNLVKNNVTPSLAWFFNTAVYDGWQKWKPTFRRAVITANDGENRHTIQLLDAESRHAKSDINVIKNASGVYAMDGSLIEVGADVVIWYQYVQEWEFPIILTTRGEASNLSIDRRYSTIYGTVEGWHSSGYVDGLVFDNYVSTAIFPDKVIESNANVGGAPYAIKNVISVVLEEGSSMTEYIRTTNHYLTISLTIEGNPLPDLTIHTIDNIKRDTSIFSWVSSTVYRYQKSETINTNSHRKLTYTKIGDTLKIVEDYLKTGWNTHWNVPQGSKYSSLRIIRECIVNYRQPVTSYDWHETHREYTENIGEATAGPDDYNYDPDRNTLTESAYSDIIESTGQYQAMIYPAA